MIRAHTLGASVALRVGCTRMLALVAAVLASLLAVGQASAVTLITPTGVTLNASSQFYPVGNLIDNSGLSAAPTLANYTTLTHASASSTNAWVTNGSGSDYFVAGVQPVMTFDLGGRYDVTDIISWGYAPGSVNNNESKEYTLRFSLDGLNFSNPVSVTHARTVFNSDTLPLGTPPAATFIRLTITDNYYGEAGATGGDRAGLGEVKFLGEAAVQSPLASEGKSYSYTVLPKFSGGTFYFDDAHVQTPGVFSPGDLTDGVIMPNSPPTVPNPSTIVGWGVPVTTATEIIMDLDVAYLVDEIALGTHTWAAFANGAPDGVQLLFSNTGIAPGDFGDSILASFVAPPTDGHHDFIVSVPEVRARYVKFVFDGGAVLTGNTPNKWMLDELSVFGQVAPVPEPATLSLLGLAGLAMLRRRGARVRLGRAV